MFLLLPICFLKYTMSNEFIHIDFKFLFNNFVLNASSFIFKYQ
jgi:hypothetical protein